MHVFWPCVLHSRNVKVWLKLSVFLRESNGPTHMGSLSIPTNHKHNQPRNKNTIPFEDAGWGCKRQSEISPYMGWKAAQRGRSHYSKSHNKITRFLFTQGFIFGWHVLWSDETKLKQFGFEHWYNKKGRRFVSSQWSRRVVALCCEGVFLQEGLVHFTN